MNIFIGLTDVIGLTDRSVFGRSSHELLQSFSEYSKSRNAWNYSHTMVHYVNRLYKRKAIQNSFWSQDNGIGILLFDSDVVNAATEFVHNIAENLNLIGNEMNSSCRCGENCITNSFLSGWNWSPCIHEEWLKITRNVNIDGLKKSPEHLFQSPTCGNSFIEHDEECDCGVSAYCTNPCCDPFSCKLRINAICGHGECCDMSTCRPYVAGSFKCRIATGECDATEYCDGQSSFCPVDVQKPEASSCNNGQSACYNGTCDTENVYNLMCGNGIVDYDEDCDCGSIEDCLNPCCDPMTCKFTDNSTCAHGDCCNLSTCRPFSVETICRHSIDECDLPEYCNGATETCPSNLFKHHSEHCDDGKAMCHNGFCDVRHSFTDEKPIHKCSEHCGANRVCNNLSQCQCENGFIPPKCTTPTQSTNDPIPEKFISDAQTIALWIFLLSGFFCMILTVHEKYVTKLRRSIK